jgi:hypothetical protein
LGIEFEEAPLPPGHAFYHAEKAPAPPDVNVVIAIGNLRTLHRPLGCTGGGYRWSRHERACCPYKLSPAIRKMSPNLVQDIDIILIK